MITLGILAYNEQENIKEVVETYIDNFDEIIVIDDCSTDETNLKVTKLVKKYSNLKIIKNSKNVGAGKSLEICINSFLNSGNKNFIKIDGDNQFKKDDILKIVNLLEKEKLDFIKCDRFWDGGIEGTIPNIRYFGNAFASLLAKFSTGNLKVNDPLNGLFGFSRRSLEDLRLPKLFYRYGYPFYFVTYMMNLSLERNYKVGQLKNTIIYLDQKKTLNPVVIFFKLSWFSLRNYYSKIKRKLKYSSLQISALVDIVSQFFLLLSFISIYRFFNIRYFGGIGPQGSWFIVFIILFILSIILLLFSLKSENENAQKNFMEFS